MRGLLAERNAMTEDIIAGAARTPGNRSRLAGYIPLLVFSVMAVFLALGLTMNPRDIPSPLIGKAVPEFSLPPVRGRELGLASADLRSQVSLVNVFASSCVACRKEHPVLMGLREKGLVPIHGVNYKDKPDDAQAWLNELGDPYTRTGADISGRVAIDWGVYGVPETYVIDRDGRIAHKHIGAITPEALRDTIMPIISKLQQ